MFKIYKGTSVVAEGESPLAITGLAADTVVNSGDYKAVRVLNGKESEKVDIPEFTVLAAQSPASLSIDEKPTMDNTIAEIKQYLTARGIDFSGVTKKEDLLKLIEG